MSETIQTYITRQIDGKESSEDLLHYQKQFNNFVKLPKNVEVYKVEGGWKQLLRPVVKTGSDPANLLAVEDLKEEDFWKYLNNLRESANTSVVSENFKNIIQESHVSKTPLEHLNYFQKHISIIMDNRIKFNYLNELTKRLTEGQIELDEFQRLLKKEILLEVKTALTLEHQHAVGGKELLSTRWAQNNNGRTLEKSTPFDLTISMQSMCNLSGEVVAVPYKKGDTKHTRKITEKNSDDKDNLEKNISEVKDKKPFIPKHALIVRKPSLDERNQKEKKVGCQICINSGKMKAALTHTTQNHDNNYSKKWEEKNPQNLKKQKVEEIKK
jgi:hypothetical protein